MSTPKRERSRENEKKTSKSVSKINSNYKAKLYGSRATNLCLMWSDIDIVINYENPKNIQTRPRE